MRVLQVIDSVHAGEGGPVEHALQVGAELGRLGDEVEIVAFREPPGTRPLERGGATVHGFGASGRYAYSRRGSRWLTENVGRFDAVLIHGLWQHSAFSAAHAARVHHIPHFMHPHGALDHALREMYPVRHAKKAVYWWLRGRRMVEHASALCFTTQEEALRASGHRAAWRTMVVGSGIEPPLEPSEASIAALHARFPQLRGARVLLFLGRLQHIKGVDVLLRAFAAVADPEVKLLIAGRGSARYEADLKRLAQTLDCSDRVCWAGLVTGEEKWAAFAIAELFVLASRQDSFGVAVVEALATGTPVLLSERVGTAAVVVGCRAGVACRGDEASLAQALRAWIAKGGGDEMPANALRCFRDNFLVADSVARLRARMLEAIPNAGSPPHLPR